MSQSYESCYPAEQSSTTAFDWSDLELSDTDVDVDSPDFKVSIEEALQYKLPFGKHKGTPLSICLKSASGRSYLRYIQKWDKLQNPAKANIDKVLSELEHRRTSKATQLKRANTKKVRFR